VVEKYRESAVIIVYRCIWGLIELFIGGYLHVVHLTQKGYVMGAFAYTLLTMYVVKHRKVFTSLVIGVIAASFKIFNILIFGVPIFSRSIVNPALAIVAEASSVTLVAYIITRVAKLKAAN